MVVVGQRRVTQHVVHVGRAQHAETATHGQVAERAVHRGKDIDKGLAVGYTLRVLVGSDELEVLGTHAHIKPDVVQILEIDIALHVEGVLVVGIEREVFKKQPGVDDAHGVVVEA